jgi:inosine-uridine nucleoside N-ribohydrolase
MGGTVFEPGNVSPVAEANIWNDPHAADRVFTAGWKLTMVGLDVTHRVVVLLSLFKRVADKHRHPATDTLHRAVEFYAKFYSGLYQHIAVTPGCYAHDLLAFIYLVDPALFEIDTKVVRVATDGLAQGQTIMNQRDFIDYPHAGWGKDKPRTQVCMKVDATACVQLFEETMMADWLPA